MNLRKPAILLCSALSFAALTGCGGPAFTGTLQTSNNNGPTPPPGAPTVTSLSPASVVAGSAAFTLTVNGTNFASGDTVDWNFSALPSTFVSSTQMTAQVPASDVVSPGSGSVTVVTSTPATLNFGASLPITVPPLLGNTAFTVSNVPIQANDMVWDPTTQLFYLSVAGTNSTAPNTITTLDPATGKLGLSVGAGTGANHLALSGDSSFLYASIDSNGSSGSNASIQRYTLPSLATDISIPLGFFSPLNPNSAADLQVAPGAPHTLAVSLGVGGTTIFDDATARTNSVSSNQAEVDILAWNSTGTDLYATSNGQSTDLYTFSVNQSGLQVANDAKIPGTINYDSLQYESATGYLYSQFGQVIDPVTSTIVGTYPSSSVQGGFSDRPIMVLDEALNIAYFLGQTVDAGGTQQYALEAYDLTHYTLLGAVGISNVTQSPVKLLRWGTNGLAFLTTFTTTFAAPTSYGVYIINGGFVTSPAAPQFKRANGLVTVEATPIAPQPMTIPH